MALITDMGMHMNSLMAAQVYIHDQRTLHEEGIEVKNYVEYGGHGPKTKPPPMSVAAHATAPSPDERSWARGPRPPASLGRAQCAVVDVDGADPALTSAPAPSGFCQRLTVCADKMPRWRCVGETEMLCIDAKRRLSSQPTMGLPAWLQRGVNPCVFAGVNPMLFSVA